MKPFIPMKDILRLIRMTDNEILYKIEDIFLAKQYSEANSLLLSSYTKAEISASSTLLCLHGHILLQLDDPDAALRQFKQASSFKDKRLPFALDSIGIVHFTLAEYEQACFFFNEAVNATPTNITYHLHLAYTNEKILSLAMAGATNPITNTIDTQIYIERIKEEYITILKYNPYHYDTIINMGVIEAKEENYEEALKYFSLAKQINKGDHKVHLNLGNVYLKQSQFLLATEAYENGLKIDGKNIKILKAYMTTLSKLENWNKLEKTCKLILKIERRNTSALAWLIKSYKNNKKYRELEALLLKIQRKVKGQNERDKAQLEKEQIEREAKEKMIKASGRSFTKKFTLGIGSNKDKSLTVDPSTAMINTKIEISDKLHRKLTEKLQEIQVKRQFTTVHDHNDMSDEEELDRSHLTTPKLDFDTIKALGYSEKDAQEFYNQLKTDKNNVNALFNLAIIKYKEEKYDHAQKYFNQILSINPSFKTQLIYEKLGDIYLKHHHNNKEALKFYEQAVRIEANAVLFIKIGRCNELMGEYATALKEYRKAHEINPHFVWSIFHVGCVMIKMKEYQEEAIDWLKKAYDLERENADILYYYTLSLVKSSDLRYLDQGIDMLEKAKDYYTGNVDLLSTLAKGYERKGHLLQAIALLEEANNYQEFFSDQFKLIQLAFFYEKAKNYRKAVEYFKAVLVINKNSITSLLHLGFIFKSATEFKKSYKCFRGALEIDKTNSQANYGLARVFQMMNQPNDAIQHYLISVQSDKMNAKAYLYMGLIYLENHQTAQALTMVEKSVAIDPENAFALSALGNVYQEMKMMKEAEEYISKAYNIDKSKLYTMTSYGNILFALGKYGEAIPLLEKAIKQQEIAEVHFTLGHAYYLIDKYDFAISHYVSALKIKKNSRHDYYYYLASALLVNSRVKDAIKCFRCAIKLNPKRSEYYFALANAYYVAKKYQKTVSYLEKCLEVDKKRPAVENMNDVRFLMFRANFSLPTINYEKCEKMIKELIMNDENNVEYLDYLASLQEKTNRTVDAIMTYRTIERIDPMNINAKESLMRLGEL